MITADELRNLLSYSPETGELRWRGKSGVKAGSLAGKVSKYGYRIVRIWRHEYMAHRLAWLYMTGEWPVATVDHKNCDTLDNRWENLRAATHKQQAANRRVYSYSGTGLKGVKLKKDRRLCYEASIRRNNTTHYLGGFATPEEANAAYRAAAEKFDGEFARA